MIIKWFRLINFLLVNPLDRFPTIDLLVVLNCEQSLTIFMNSLALSVLGIDGFTFAAIVILIKFNVNLLDCSQASWRDLSASILVFVMTGQVHYTQLKLDHFRLIIII